MKRREFTLKPFPAGDPPLLWVSGCVERHGDVLSIRWELSGWLEPISIPDRSVRPERKTGLWEETCFEFFASSMGSDRYWEVNVSPSGDWNVYSFESYRLGMREEEAYGSLPVRVERRGTGLMLALDLDLGRIVPPGQPLRGGVAAVIRRPNGDLSYWALRHRGPKPDFHRRDGFTLAL